MIPYLFMGLGSRMDHDRLGKIIQPGFFLLCHSKEEIHRIASDEKFLHSSLNIK
jgi:hypothetical protein